MHGGAGLTRAAAAAVFEALAGGDTPLAAMLTIHNMVANAINAHGSAEQKGEWLPRLASMDSLASYCLTEPGAGSDAASLRTTAVPVAGGGWELTGEKAFISGASAAGLFLVLARVADAPPGAAGISAFLVDAATTYGISVGPPERKMGWKLQPTCSVSYDRALLPPTALLGPPGAGFKLAMAALDGGRVNIGAVSVGCAGAAVERARVYAAGRTQFGSRVADFQATRFALADAATAVHASRLLVRSAAAALDAGCPTATLQAAAAKRFSTDACFDAANAAMQVFGGYGYLAEYGAERAVRDLRWGRGEREGRARAARCARRRRLTRSFPPLLRRVHSILEGTNQIMRLVISRELDRLDPVGQ